MKKIKGIPKTEYFKAYREINKDKIAEQRKAYRETNKDKIAEQRKAYRETNKDKIAEQMKAYRETNKDKIAEQMKAYYEANKDKIAEQMKAYREAKRRLWKNLSDEEQLRLMNEKAKELLKQSPTSQTSPNGDFSNEKEHNISLKDNSNELSQISSNDETSLNNNIKQNKLRLQ